MAKKLHRFPSATLDADAGPGLLGSADRPRTARLALLAGIVAGVPFWCSAAGRLPAPVAPATAVPAASYTDPTELAAIAAELQTDMASIAETHTAFLDDPWLRVGGSHFGLAQQAAKSLVADGAPKATAINEFHNRLDEFLRAIDSLPEWEPGTGGWDDVKGTKKPSAAATKKVHQAIVRIKEKANKVPEFQEVALVTFGDATTPEQVAEYGERILEKIDVLLFNRGLGQITGEGRSQTKEILGPSLEQMRDALSELAEPDGSDNSEAAKATPEAASKRDHLTQSITAVRNNGELLSRALPWAKARIELMYEDLDRLEKNLGRLKAVRK